VLICESNLSDGSWRDVLSGLAAEAAAPPLILVSRLADDHLWAEVLNLGGYDVLSKPFDAREVLWSVHHACSRFRIGLEQDVRGTIICVCQLDFSRVPKGGAALHG
jgi:DNA-binding response OmpR family regulator